MNGGKGITQIIDINWDYDAIYSQRFNVIIGIWRKCVPLRSAIGH